MLKPFTPENKRLIRDYWCLQTPISMFICDVTMSWRHVDIMTIIAIHCDSLCTNCQFLKTGLVDHIGILKTPITGFTHGKIVRRRCPKQDIPLSGHDKPNSGVNYVFWIFFAWLNNSQRSFLFDVFHVKQFCVYFVCIYNSASST